MVRSHESKFCRKKIVEAIDELQRKRKATTEENIIKYLNKKHRLSPTLIHKGLHCLHGHGYVFKFLSEKGRCYVSARNVYQNIKSLLNKPTSTTEASQEYSRLFAIMSSEVLMRAFLHLVNERDESSMCEGFFPYEIERAIREVVTKRMRCSEMLDLIIKVLPELLKREKENGNLTLLKDGRYQAKIKRLLANLDEENRFSQHLKSVLKMGGGDERNKEFRLSLNRNTMSSTDTKVVESPEESPIVTPEELLSSTSFGQINGDAAKFFLDELIRSTIKSTEYMKQSQEQTQAPCRIESRIQFYEWLKNHL
nr:hypothetical protein HmN_000302500 [Hymenolepis microstoma]